MSALEFIFYLVYLLVVLPLFVIMLIEVGRMIYCRLIGKPYMPENAEARIAQEVDELVDQSRSCMGAGESDQAMLLVEKAIILDPNNWKALFLRALLQSARGDHLAAIEGYSQAIKANPDEAGSYVSRGLSYQQLGNMEQALADFNQAVALDPDNMVVRLCRLRLHKELGSIQAAWADFEHALEANPELKDRESARKLRAELEKVLADSKLPHPRGTTRAKPPCGDDENA